MLQSRTLSVVERWKFVSVVRLLPLVVSQSAQPRYSMQHHTCLQCSLVRLLLPLLSSDQRFEGIHLQTGVNVRSMDSREEQP